MDKDHLLELALMAQTQPLGSLDRYLALTKLVEGINQSPKFIRYYAGISPQHNEEIYREAWQLLFLYLCQNIEKYNPTKGNVINYVNYLMKKRFFPEAIRLVIGDKQEYLMEAVPDQPIAPPSLGAKLYSLIDEDPDRIFGQVRMENYPSITFQIVALQRLNGEKWKDIASQWQVKISSISDFYHRHLERFLPMIREHLET